MRPFSVAWDTMKTPLLRRRHACDDNYHDAGESQCDNDRFDIERVVDDAGNTLSISHDCDSQKKRHQRSTYIHFIFKVIQTCTIAVVMSISVGVIAWIGLYLRQPYQRDTSCSVPQWVYPNCNDRMRQRNNSTALDTALSSEQWIVLRKKYQLAVGNVASSFSDGWDSFNSSGFKKPIVIKHTPDRGRGVFAVEANRKGEMLWQNDYQGIFPDECSIKKFFAMLTNDQICDVLVWGYVSHITGIGNKFMLDFDAASYGNHDTKDQNTIYTCESTGTKKDICFFAATRDISPDEEIIFNYNEFLAWDVFHYYIIFEANSRSIWDWLNV